MLFRLDAVQSGKDVVKTLNFEKEFIERPSGTICVENVSATLKFRTDPLGFVVKYEIRADVSVDCVRCAEPVSTTIHKSDWLSLRPAQPKEGHIMLANAEMNVRFLENLRFDMADFTKEIIELEISPYPRHEAGSAECRPSSADNEPVPDHASPFSVLSKFLDSTDRDPMNID